MDTRLVRLRGEMEAIVEQQRILMLRMKTCIHDIQRIMTMEHNEESVMQSDREAGKQGDQASEDRR
jgi:hypothetical protein